MKLLLEAYDTSIWLKEDGSVEICLPEITLPPIKGESKSALSRRIASALDEFGVDMYGLHTIWQHCGALREMREDNSTLLEDEEAEDE